jgi:phosphoenolpyruvate carboxykinase (ATP)
MLPERFSHAVATENNFIFSNEKIHYQLPPDELIKQTLLRKQGILNDTGALCVYTGEFTGRCPKDKYIVKDSITSNSIDWNGFNQPIAEEVFFHLKEKMVEYLNQCKELWIRDCLACAAEAYQINIRVVNEHAWSNLFAYNMFIRPTETQLKSFQPDWTILQAPGFKANPQTDGVKHSQFIIISFEYKTILIGGTAYTGEMKKGIFSILNFLLPTNHHVLSMHCSANEGKNGDVALFFGLSGTGKTTLSADPHRNLIGDDEHGWNENGIFNLEGGCYAKCIDLSQEKEPMIFNAIKHGALVENVTFKKGTNTIDYHSKIITENTRASFPIQFINNYVPSGQGNIPTNIFFLSCDAFGVLPPISRLTTEQAVYYFINGYTAKIAGTENGIQNPVTTFSACFGAPFMPLHPLIYANMLKQKIEQYNVKVWLINTGWTGGRFGVGRRMPLEYTRAMVKAILEGQLDNEAYKEHPIFKLHMVEHCPNVPSELLNPVNTWSNKNEYEQQARLLEEMLRKNFTAIQQTKP